VDFAETAIAIDPGLERAHRALMRAYAGLGETARALRAFEDCRRNLSSALGADPSSQTSAVHLQILSGPVPSFSDGRLVGRDEDEQHQHPARLEQDGAERAGGRTSAGIVSGAGLTRLHGWPPGRS
jgi:DNA-binding SARP family transcriptional activator